MSNKSVCVQNRLESWPARPSGDIRFGAAAGPTNYMIINSPTFTGNAGLNNLVAAKTAQGFNVTIKEFPTTVILRRLEPTSNSFGIRPTPDYILIVGDSNLIPAWYGQGTRHANTDLYYACMDGPDDWCPDVPIGRYPVHYGALTAVVNKTNYVEAGSFADPGYITRVAFLATDDQVRWRPDSHDAMIEAYTTPAGLTPTRIYFLSERHRYPQRSLRPSTRAA